MNLSIRRAVIGYWYWYMKQCPFGWRQIGPEAHVVMDNFGDLVFTGGVCNFLTFS